jgi:hypothetical protein
MIMKKSTILLVAGALLVGASAQAEEASITCETLAEDYRITSAAEQLTESPDLFGACEEVVMRDGAPFIKVSAVVRRAGRDSVRLYVPATDRTVEITPQEDLRVMIDGRKVRPSRLDRGQEIRIYLSVDEFTRPRPEPVQQVALATETEEIRQIEATPVAALPTTASLWPAFGAFGALFVAGGLLVRRLRNS